MITVQKPEEKQEASPIPSRKQSLSLVTDGRQSARPSTRSLGWRLHGLAADRPLRRGPGPASRLMLNHCSQLSPFSWGLTPSWTVKVRSPLPNAILKNRTWTVAYGLGKAAADPCFSNTLPFLQSCCITWPSLSTPG